MKSSLLVAALLVLGLTACGKKEQPAPAMAPAPAAEAPKPAQPAMGEENKPSPMAEEKKPEEKK